MNEEQRYMILTGSSWNRAQALTNLEDVVNGYHSPNVLIFIGGVSIVRANTPDGRKWFASQAVVLRDGTGHE